MTELEKASTSVKKKFKRALIENDLKQVELARAIDETPAQVSRALSGNSTPKDIYIQKKAAKILGIEI
jgi:transcriptional regulator with XRE-family HTH domain